jgi:peptidoglycan/xylan/chitin deacetylase (PgdA/CDA1 family)
MTIRAQIGRARRKVLSAVYSRRVSLASGGPLVSFTFDDFPRTALTVGGRILKDFGFRGTYYASMGLMNTSSELGDQFRREDLETLLCDGHELASHTFGHISCRSVSCSRFRREVETGRRAIEELTGQRDSGNFAYPFGEVTLSVKEAIGQDVNSSRGIWGGVNGTEVDLNLLRANRLYGDLDKCAQVEELIVENERRKSWLIFYSHDVRETPSPVGCTPALLEFAVSFAAQRRGRVRTVTDVVHELGKQRER